MVLTQRACLMSVSALFLLTAACATRSDRIPTDDQGRIDQQWVMALSDQEIEDHIKRLDERVVEIREEVLELSPDIAWMREEIEGLEPESRERFAHDLRKLTRRVRRLGEELDQCRLLVDQLFLEQVRRFEIARDELDANQAQLIREREAEEERRTRER